MPIVFPANPGAQTPANVFSPTSTPVQNTFNEASYRWVAADSQWVYDGPNVDPNPGSAIATPSITNPADESTGINPGVDLTINSSPYTVQSGNPGIHASSDWQVLEGVSPKISIDTVGGITTVNGNETEVSVFTRTSNDSNSNFRGPQTLYADGNNWFMIGSDGRPSGNSNTHGPTRFFFSTDNAASWTEATYYQTGTGTNEGNLEVDLFDDWYIGWANTQPTVTFSLMGLRKDSAFTGSPVWRRFIMRSVGDGTGNQWSPQMDYRRIGDWSNGKYITYTFFQNGGVGQTYPMKCLLWSDFAALEDAAMDTQQSLQTLTGLIPESGWTGGASTCLARSYKTLGTDNDAYNLLYTEETKSGEKTVKKMRVTWDTDIDTDSFDEANTTDLTDILDDVGINSMVPWPSQNCVVCGLTGPGLIGVYRNGGTSANPQAGTFEIIETPKDTVQTVRMYIGPDDFLYLLSSDNAEWTRTSDLVNFATEQVAEDTGFRSPYTISSNGRMGTTTPQDNDMASSNQPVSMWFSDQFFDATILDIANCNVDSGVIGKAFEPGDTIQNSGGAAAAGTIFELNNSTVSLFPVEGTWMADDSQRIRSKIEDYNVVIDNRSDTTNLTSITVPAASLNANEEYSVRVGYRSNSNVTSLDSPWSTFETGS